MATAKNYAQYPLTGFAYGLNTAMDESLLSTKYSPRMLNMFVSESESVKRRRGHSAVQFARVSATAGINAMYRFYKGSSKYMVYVCGTHMFAHLVSATSYAETDKQFLTTTVVATYGENITGNNYVNGNALLVTATCQVVATFPDCTNLTIKIPTMSASIKTNSGSWVSVTGTTKASLTPTPGMEQTIRIKPTASNNASIALNNAGVARLVSQNVNQFSVYFYDSGYVPPVNPYTFSMYMSAEWSYGVGINTAISGSNYIVFGNISSIVRTTGWHRIDVKKNYPGYSYIDVYLDGTWVAGAWLELSGLWVMFYGGPDNTGYVDKWIEDYKLIDDCANLNNFGIYWGTPTISNSVYHASPQWMVLDEAKFSYVNTPTYITKVCSTVTDRHSFITMNDKVYFSNEFRPLKTYDGSVVASVTATGTIPCAGYMVDNKNRSFLAYQSNRSSISAGIGYADKTMLIFSAIGNPDDFHVSADAGQLRVVPEGGDAICTGMAVFGDKVYYFSPSRCAVLNTTGIAKTDWTNNDISTSHGCIAPKSLAVGDKGIVFLSADGVRGYGPLQQIFANDGSGFSFMSKNVSGLNVSTGKGMSVPSGHTEYKERTGYTDAERASAVGAFFESSYWLFIGGDCYVADLNKKTDNNQPVWTKHRFTGLTDEGTRVTSAMVLRGDEYALYVGTEDARVYKMEYGNSDDGMPIDFEYYTPPIPIGGYNTLKYFKTAELGVIVSPDAVPNTYTERSLYSATANIYFVTDEQARSFYEQIPTQKSLVAATMGSDIRPIRLPISTSGRSIQMRVSGNNNGAPLELPYVIFRHGRPRGR